VVVHGVMSMVEYSLHKVCTGFYAVAMGIPMPACKICMPAWEYSHPAEEANNSKIVVMETVILCLTDNNCAKHIFTLTHVSYMPKYPVNILSMRVLSEQFPNENGFD
jgi:hypothetical protein